LNNFYFLKNKILAYSKIKKMTNEYRRSELRLYKGLEDGHPMKFKCETNGNVVWELNNEDGSLRKDIELKCGIFNGPFAADGTQVSLKSRMVGLDNAIATEQTNRTNADATIDAKVMLHKGILDELETEVVNNKSLEATHNTNNLAKFTEVANNRATDIADNQSARDLIAASISTHITEAQTASVAMYDAIGSNTYNISAEAETRASNDAVVADNAAALVNDEQERAESAESALNNLISTLDAFVKTGSVETRLNALEGTDADHLALLNQIGLDWAASDSNLQTLLTGQYTQNSARLTYLEGVVAALVPDS